MRAPPEGAEPETRRNPWARASAYRFSGVSARIGAGGEASGPKLPLARSKPNTPQTGPTLLTVPARRASSVDRAAATAPATPAPTPVPAPLPRAARDPAPLFPTRAAQPGAAPIQAPEPEPRAPALAAAALENTSRPPATPRRRRGWMAAAGGAVALAAAAAFFATTRDRPDSRAAQETPAIASVDEAPATVTSAPPAVSVDQAPSVDVAAAPRAAPARGSDLEVPPAPSIAARPRQARAAIEPSSVSARDGGEDRASPERERPSSSPRASVDTPAPSRAAAPPPASPRPAARPTPTPSVGESTTDTPPAVGPVPTVLREVDQPVDPDAPIATRRDDD